MRIDYGSIQDHIKDRKRRVDEFLAMHRNNDPYYVGSDRDKRDGKWFAENWKRFGFTKGVHVRRMHYALVSASPAIMMPDGQTPYHNTMECYHFLDRAATSARYLDLVDPSLFVDHRNEEPIVELDFTTKRVCEVSVTGGPFFSSPASLYLPTTMPGHEVETFSEPQRYHLEIWCEKSTMNDILVPLAQQYEAAFVYGKGELSITLAYQAVQRFQRSGKPVRIFYVSDFDPSGRDMPVNMIRKVEYFLDKLDCLKEIDVRLFPIVLTPEQVRHYAQMTPPLLTTPLKEDKEKSRTRAKKFYELYGVDGGVELDALEIVHPGELARILTEELDRYYDHDLTWRVMRAKNSAKTAMQTADAPVYSSHTDEINELKQLEKEIRSLYNEHLMPKLNRYFELYRPVSNTIQQELMDTSLDVSIDNVPSADYAEEREGALFDSSWDYEQQLEVYQCYKRNVPIPDECL